MKVRKALVAVAVAVTLLFTALKPAPARADSTTDIAIIIGSVIGGGILLALIITPFIRNNPAWMPVAPVDPDADPILQAEPAVQFGLDCRTAAGGPALVCW